MFKKVLIANRGEIATRVIRACKELGISTVAIYSEDDATSLYVKKAAESYLVGPGPIEGYLNIHRIVDLASKVGVDAIHPGYGFLAENHAFAELCEKKGITFIGPASSTIKDMGDKVRARELVQKFGVPVVPGTEGSIKSADEAIKFAGEIGYPVMVKASGGGGGRGLRIARNEKELISGIETAQSEAKGSFGTSDVFIEKYLERPHHIEFQILADKYGSIIYLGERDCSIQRRHQKLIEIAPSLLLDNKLRKEMGDAAVRAARAANYTNAGTVEFLVDTDRRFYFLEMNTRIQVEHTITEEITGIDLVKKQIEIAASKRLDIKQEDINIRGFAIECRICAEDPKRNFAPNSGRVTAYYSPGGIGVRIDGAIYKDYIIPRFYDSMVAKLVVRGMTWEETVNRMNRSLEEFVIRGVKTTIPFLRNVMQDPDFRNGNFDTGYIDRKPELLNYDEFGDPVDKVAAISTAIAAYHGF
ncbi:MAG: acetyl-CoA carboxylase biotin carboxylase subunit [Deltaproteobacteria bacterium GWC2_42_11]|nr:MAG: acetyl-CoA carboxylase biotin carboxylase subunit [Deltaproteobacteria bacterium GWC2_42_11]HBO84910.1 acetyl-CoA carboxylase biotin carboxylase subunit [Deltaproteobacteria bacterium]